MTSPQTLPPAGPAPQTPPDGKLTPGLPLNGATVQSDSSVSPATEAPSAASPTVILALLGGLAALVSWLYLGSFRWLVREWTVDENYSHGFLIPLVAAYLAWDVAKREGPPRRPAPFAGLAWLTAGLLAHLWGQVLLGPVLDFLGLACILYGVAMMLGGRSWARRFLFPILFLGLMFPLPPRLVDAVAVTLQDVVARAAGFVLQLVTPVYKEGNYLHLAGTSLEVGEACSGLRQMLAFLALGLLVAYFSRRGPLFRTLIVAAAVPVAVLANLLRILVLAAVVVNVGPGWISEKEYLPGLSLHTMWGLLTMAVGLVLFLGVKAWLDRVFPAAAETPAVEAGDGGAGPVGWTLPADAVLPLAVALPLAAGAVGLQLGLHAHLNAASNASKPELRQPLASLAKVLGDWTGVDEEPHPDAKPYFEQADDRLNRSYVHGAPPLAGMEAGLWMVHFKDGSDRRHHPLICYGIRGYAEVPEEGKDVPLAGQAAPARRFCFTRNPTRSYVYYWHYTLEPAASEGLSFLQRLHQEVGARRPSVTVQVYVAGRTPTELERAEDFVRRVDEQLRNELLPPEARRGNYALPIRPMTGPNP